MPSMSIEFLYKKLRSVVELNSFLLEIIVAVKNHRAWRGVVAIPVLLCSWNVKVNPPKYTNNSVLEVILPILM